MHRVIASLALSTALLAIACGDRGGERIEASTGASTAAESSTSTSTSSTSTSTTASTATTASTGESTGGSSTGLMPSEPLCDVISVPLVVDRQAPVYSADRRARLRTFFDDLVAQTGAEVRILPNSGAPSPPLWFCLQGSDDVAGGNTFVWGKDFVADPDGPGVLDCILDDIREMPYDGDADGDWMFTGLMFPILDHADWPAPETDITLAMALAQADDDEGGMYPRPGMASEAFIRLAGDGDRRRIAAFAMGADGDQLQLFTLSLGDTSQYHDWGETNLTAALDAWTPVAVQACADHDEPPAPVMPGGCEHIDILFVIDGSLSMMDEQAALRGDNGQPPVLAEFTDALQAELDTLVDFHVGVISSEPGDITLHTHHDQPAEPPSAATDCGLPMGQRWLVGPSPTLEEDFACLAATRAEDTLESTAQNAAWALNDPINSGFLRDDAVLFLVMLTDEDTQDGITQLEIRRQILDAIDGQLERLVALAIVGDQGVFEMPKTVCQGVYGGASPGRKITSIVYSFREQGFAQDICGGELASIFTEVLDDVVTTCHNFHPEG